MKHRLLVVLIVLVSSLSVAAQKFVLDPLFGDSVKCHVAVKADTVWKLKEPLQNVMLERDWKLKRVEKRRIVFMCPFGMMARCMW